MQLAQIINRVRAYTRDTTGSLFVEGDVTSFINEGVDRFRRIKELENMVYLQTNTQEPILLPIQFHYLLAIYSASRCFTQDEQHNSAQLFMSEFENKMFELERDIKNGSVIIKDKDGEIVVSTDIDDAVKDVYFARSDIEDVE
ncbi:hypothetical protein [Romboutsia sp.]|uniref:hypothetical protein n=1 Tax=Romboutsia sp. TaxID=1965302 RepID=UPI002CF9692A|nr:hypothetical protein [Romboutsia sp.]HSQ90154.1 hypothetical protein [Romboutsia sp.]